jgi:hypothetical protein
MGHAAATLNTGVSEGDKARIFLLEQAANIGAAVGVPAAAACGIIQKAFAGTIIQLFPTAKTGTDPCGVGRSNWCSRRYWG